MLDRNLLFLSRMNNIPVFFVLPGYPPLSLVRKQVPRTGLMPTHKSYAKNTQLFAFVGVPAAAQLHGVVTCNMQHRHT